MKTVMIPSLGSPRRLPIEADLKAMLKDSFSINPSESLKLRAQAAGVVVAWKTAISRVERQAEAEATNEVRDLAKPIPSTDYIAMRQAFAAKFGELEDKHIHAKEYIEKKLAELESGEFSCRTANGDH